VSGATYWIESVDLNGTRKLHGPVVPRLAVQSLGRAISSDSTTPDSLTLSDLRAPLDVRGSSQRAISSEASPSANAGNDNHAGRQFEPGRQTAAKILVSREGYYRVSRAPTGRGRIRSWNDPRSLSLFVDGQEISDRP
jgi:hypothetical protein